MPRSVLSPSLAIQQATERFAHDVVALVQQAVLAELREGSATRPKRPTLPVSDHEWPWPGTLAREVLEALRRHPNGLRNAEAATATRARPNRVARCLSRLERHGVVEKLPGRIPVFVAVAR